MNDAIELGKMLHDTPDLFPWVVLAIVLIVIIAQHKRILSYFDARIEAYREKQQSDAVLAELIRNNTAALNNNTAALEAVKNDRGLTRELLKHHEEASKERIDSIHDSLDHIQTVLNRVDGTVSNNSESIRIVEDRTRNK